MILRSLFNQPKPNQPTSQFRHGSINTRVSGVIVNEDTALTYSAVYLATKIISETLAGLPAHVFTRVPGSTDKKIAEGHYLQALMNQPNSEMTGYNFRRTIASHAILRGNGYAYILRDRSNRPSELQLITPDRVTKGRDKNTGKITYKISNNVAAPSFYDDDQIFHFAGMGFDGLVGYSIVTLARRTFGLGMAAEEFGTSFYENGAQLGTVIEVPPEIELDEDGRDLLLKTFDEKHRGVKHHHKTTLIDKGMKVTTLGIKQKDAQFIESRKFNVTEVARWFNLPPHKLKDLEKATFSNIEELNIDFVQDTMLPWVINWEQTSNWKLLGRNNTRQFVKLGLNGLLRGDSKARSEYYKTRFNLGSITPNEIREFEDENSMGPDGDHYFLQGAMSTIENIIKPPEPPAPTTPQIPTTTEADSGEENDDDEGGAADGQAENLQRFRPLIENAMGKIVSNIDERSRASMKKDKALKLDQAVADVLENRASYIEENIEPILNAVANVDHSQVASTVGDISETIANNLSIDLGDLKSMLVGDFIEFCAKLQATDKGDA